MKTYKIKIHPYEKMLHILVGDHEEIPKAISRLFGDVSGLKENGYYDCSHLSGLFTYVTNTKTGIKNYIIWLRHAKKDTEFLLTIAHESLHCAFNVLHDIGITHAEESEEAYTYLHEKIMADIIKKVL